MPAPVPVPVVAVSAAPTTVPSTPKGLRSQSREVQPVTSATTESTAAQVRLKGDAERVVLTQGRQPIALPAEVQSGAYTVLATLPGGEPPIAYGELVARAGATYEINCVAAMSTCRTLELP